MMTPNLKIKITGKTDLGQVRAQNEDDFIVCQDIEKNIWQFDGKSLIPGEKGALLLVADGMGGFAAGDVAAKITVDEFKQIFENLKETPTSDEACRKLLEDSLLQAHQKIVDDLAQNPARQNMGTTAVVAWWKANKVYLSWIGDSRAYLYRPSVDLEMITDDHAPVWDMVLAGKMTPEEARIHPDSNFISQHLGQTFGPPIPESITIEPQAEDLLLLCSDGLNALVTDEEIKAIFIQKKTLEESCQLLVDTANDRGGVDNITVLLLEVLGEKIAHSTTVMPTNKATKLMRKQFTLQSDTPNKRIATDGLSQHESKSSSNWLLIATVFLGLLTLLNVGFIFFYDKNQTEELNNSQVEWKKNQAVNAVWTTRDSLFFKDKIDSIGQLSLVLRQRINQTIEQSKLSKELQDTLADLQQQSDIVQLSQKLAYWENGQWKGFKKNNVSLMQSNIDTMQQEFAQLKEAIESILGNKK